MKILIIIITLSIPAPDIDPSHPKLERCTQCDEAKASWREKVRQSLKRVTKGTL